MAYTPTPLNNAAKLQKAPGLGNFLKTNVSSPVDERKIEYSPKEIQFLSQLKNKGIPMQQAFSFLEKKRLENPDYFQKWQMKPAKDFLGSAVAKVPEFIGNTVGGGLSFMGKAKQALPTNIPVSTVGGALLKAIPSNAGDISQQVQDKGTEIRQNIESGLGVNPQSTASSLGRGLTSLAGTIAGGELAGTSKLIGGAYKGLKGVSTLGQALPKLGTIGAIGGLENVAFEQGDTGKMTPDTLGYGAGFSLAFAGLPFVGKALSKVPGAGIIKNLARKLEVSGIINPVKYDQIKKQLLEEGVDSSALGKKGNVNDLADWMLKRNIQGDKETMVTTLEDLGRESVDAKKSVLGESNTMHNPEQAKYIVDDIVQELEGSSSKERKALYDKYVGLSKKSSYTLSELDDIRGDAWSILNPFTASGKVIRGAEDIKGTISDLKRYIEKAAEEEGLGKSLGYDGKNIIRDLNNQTQIAYALAEGIARRDSTDATGQLVSFLSSRGASTILGGYAGSEVGPFDSSTITGKIGNVILGALVGGIAGSTRAKSIVANRLDNISGKNKSELYDWMQSRATKELSQESAKELEKINIALSKLDTDANTTLPPKLPGTSTTTDGAIPMKDNVIGNRNIDTILGAPATMESNAGLVENGKISKLESKKTGLANKSKKLPIKTAGNSEQVSKKVGLEKKLRLYHGTTQGNKIDKFDLGRMREGNLGKGIYLTNSYKAAQYYGNLAEEGTMSKDIESMMKPSKKGDVLSFDLEGAKIKNFDYVPTKAEVSKAKEMGFDGVSYTDKIAYNTMGRPELLGIEKDVKSYMLFDDSKIKYAPPTTSPLPKEADSTPTLPQTAKSLEPSDLTESIKKAKAEGKTFEEFIEGNTSGKKVYHFTNSNFDEIDISKSKFGDVGKGFYTTDNIKNNEWGKNKKIFFIKKDAKIRDVNNISDAQLKEYFEAESKKLGKIVKPNKKMLQDYPTAIVLSIDNGMIDGDVVVVNSKSGGKNYIIKNKEAVISESQLRTERDKLDNSPTSSKGKMDETVTQTAKSLEPSDLTESIKKAKAEGKTFEEFEKVLQKEGKVIGEGNSGKVYEMGGFIYKNDTGNEGKILEIMKGSDNVISGEKVNGKLKLPKAKRVLSIDDIKDEFNRYSMGETYINNETFGKLNRGVSEITNNLIHYGDQMQVGVFDDGLKILDFSISRKTADDVFSYNNLYDNLDALGKRYSDFGASGYKNILNDGKAVSRIFNSLAKKGSIDDIMKGDYTEQLGKQGYEAVEKAFKEGFNGDYIYYARDARPVMIEGTYKVPTKNRSMLLSKNKLSDSQIENWELQPIIEIERKPTSQLRTERDKLDAPTTTAISKDIPKELIEEAKKYKSAEEFMLANEGELKSISPTKEYKGHNTKLLYHGTTESKAKLIKEKGLSASIDRNGKGKGKGYNYVSFSDSPVHADRFGWGRGENSEVLAIRPDDYKFMDINTDFTNKFGSRELDRTTNEVRNYLKSKGYDGLKFKAVDGGFNEYRLFDNVSKEKVIDLRKIREEANKK